MRNKFFFAATRSFTCAAAFIFIFGTTALAQKAATWKGGTSGKFTDWNCHTNWKEGQSPNEFSQITSPLFAQHNEVVLTAPKNSSNTFSTFTPVRTMPTDIYDDNLQPDDYKIMSMEDRQLAKRIYLQKTNDLGEDLNAAETSLDDPLPGEFQMEYMDRIGQSPVSRHMEKLSDLGEDFIVPPAAPSRTARHPLPMKPGEVQPLLLLEDCIMEFADGRWRPVVKSGSTKKRYNRIFSKTDKNRR